MPMTMEIRLFVEDVFNVNDIITIYVDRRSKVYDVKFELELKLKNISSDDMILTYNGQTLKDDATLDQYGIERDSKIILNVYSSNNNDRSISHSQKTLQNFGELVQHNVSHTKSASSLCEPPQNICNAQNSCLTREPNVPSFHYLCEGLNLQCECTDKSCVSSEYRYVVIVMVGLGKHNMIDKCKNLKCPVCGAKVIMNTFGFYNCQYEICAHNEGETKIIKSGKTTDIMLEMLAKNSSNQAASDNIANIVVETWKNVVFYAK